MVNDEVVEIKALLTDSADEVHIGTSTARGYNSRVADGEKDVPSKLKDGKVQLARGTFPWYLRLGGWSEDDEGFRGADLPTSKHI
jgi:hypothetical protein